MVVVAVSGLRLAASNYHNKKSGPQTQLMPLQYEPLGIDEFIGR